MPTNNKRQLAKAEVARNIEELASAGEQYQESLGKDDMSIPFLQILQSLSPQCTRGEAEYIKGAEASDLLDTVTGEIFKTRDVNDESVDGVRILPVHYRRSFVEWVPRHKGGGFVKEWPVEEGLSISTARNESNADIILDGSLLGTPGNQLADTHTHFVFRLKDDGGYDPMLMTMSSTQIKPSKDLNNLVSKLRLPDGRRAPRFFGIFGVSTRRRSNDQGSWYVWSFNKVGDILADGRMELFREAKQFLEGISAGEHKVDFEKADGAAAATNAEEPPF